MGSCNLESIRTTSPRSREGRAPKPRYLRDHYAVKGLQNTRQVFQAFRYLSNGEEGCFVFHFQTGATVTLCCHRVDPPGNTATYLISQTGLPEDLWPRGMVVEKRLFIDGKDWREVQALSPTEKKLRNLLCNCISVEHR